MVTNQEKFKRMQEATRARKTKEAGSSFIPTSSSLPTSSTPPPSIANSAATYPHVEVVGEKRGPTSEAEEQRPPKNSRVEVSSAFVEGLHRLQPGVPAQRFLLPAAFPMGEICSMRALRWWCLKLIRL
jgi:hypothetical protein